MNIIWKVIIIIIAFIYLISSVYNFSLSDLNNPMMFSDEICSYNGQFNTSDNSSFTCICQIEYANDTTNTQTINGVKVQCSYAKKRRFIALFLSIFLPFGMDYLYLNRYAIFVLVLFLCCFTLVGNCYRFAISDQKNYFKTRLNALFLILAIVVVCLWIMNIIFIGTGFVKDGNGIETVDDLYFLVNLNN